MERSVASASHCPLSVRDEPFGVSFAIEYDIHDPSRLQLGQYSNVKFADRLMFYRHQSEISAVNIETGAITNTDLKYPAWLVEMEQRISSVKSGCCRRAMVVQGGGIS